MSTVDGRPSSILLVYAAPIIKERMTRVEGAGLFIAAISGFEFSCRSARWSGLRQRAYEKPKKHACEQGQGLRSRAKGYPVQASWFPIGD